MANPIPSGGVNPVRPVRPVEQTPATAPASKVEGKSFKELLLENLDEVNRLQLEADRGVQRLLTGETDNVAEVFNAVNKAGVAFDLLMEIRNKLQEAYQEVQQMRI
jgi:flagellar hook-basal body complex protein FliE